MGIATVGREPARKKSMHKTTFTRLNVPKHGPTFNVAVLKNRDWSAARPPPLARPSITQVRQGGPLRRHR